jgi:hypothetical protein
VVQQESAALRNAIPIVIAAAAGVLLAEPA